MFKPVLKTIKIMALLLPLFAFTNSWAQVGPIHQATLPAQSAIIESAESMRGVPYIFGGDSLETGLDCSSYVQKVFASVGVYLPRTAKEQSRDRNFVFVPRSQIKKGDLIFFKNTYKKGISHVGIVLDKQHMLHASQENGVVTEARFIPGGLLSKKIAFVKRLKPSVERRINDSMEA